jgi:hypothetical protein
MMNRSLTCFFVSLVFSMIVQRVLHVLQEAQVQGIHAGREALQMKVTLAVCCGSKM